MSAFADDETIDLLRKHYVSVAPSLTEELKARDAGGDFFRTVVNQRAEPKHSKQGYYICSPDGTLLKGWMYPRPDDGTMKRFLKETLQSYHPPTEVPALDGSKVDRNANPLPPEGGLVVEVYSKIIDAKWQPTNLERFQIIRGNIGRDRFWLLKTEVQELLKGVLPDSLLERMIRFHLIDTTRGVAGAWQRGDIKAVQIKLSPESGKVHLEGSVRIEEAGNRRYDAKVYGTLETKGNAVTRFDVLVRGAHSATKPDVGEAPVGTSTLAVAFALAGSGETSRVPPLYSWQLGEYLRTTNLRVTELRGQVKE